MRRATWIICCAVAGLGGPTALGGGVPRFCSIGMNFGAPEADSASASGSASDGGVGTARDQLHRVAIQLSRQFQSSSEYQAATLAALQALSAYQVAQATVIQQVQSTPQSQAVNVEIDRLERQLEQARTEANMAGRDHSDKTDAIVMALLNARASISQREAKALAADDGINSLRYAWLDANAALESMRDDLAGRVQTDPRWKSAKAQLDQVRVALVSASE
jgi:hypothetical protein